MKNKIATLRQKRGQAVDRMEANVECSTPEQKATYDAAEAEIAEIDAQIQRLEKIEVEKARSAVPVDPQQRTEVDAAGSQNPNRGKGDAIARVARSLAAGRGDVRRAAEYAEQTLHDGQVAKALAAGSGTAGGFLVPEEYVAEIVEFLRPASVVRRMGARVVPMPGGNMTLPKLTGGATATYIGENTNIGKTEPTFGQLKLSAKKLAALVPISNDLIRFSSPQADTVVREDLVASLSQTQDANFLRSDGTGNGPKGLRYWAPAANILAVNATVNLANVDKDLGRLILALQNANVRMIQPGWLFAPRTQVYLQTLRDGNGNKAYPEVDNGMLRGFPYATTTQIPINLAVTDTAESEIYFIDFADVVIGEVPGMILEVSTEAAYYDGSNVVSAFSLDQTVIRAIVQHDLGMRHDASIAVLKDVDWGA